MPGCQGSRGGIQPRLKIRQGDPGITRGGVEKRLLETLGIENRDIHPKIMNGILRSFQLPCGFKRYFVGSVITFPSDWEALITSW